MHSVKAKTVTIDSAAIAEVKDKSAGVVLVEDLGQVSIVFEFVDPKGAIEFYGKFKGIEIR